MLKKEFEVWVRVVVVPKVARRVILDCVSIHSGKLNKKPATKVPSNAIRFCAMDMNAAFDSRAPPSRLSGGLGMALPSPLTGGLANAAAFVPSKMLGGSIGAGEP